MANPQNSIFEIKNFFGRHLGLQRDNRYSIIFENLPPEVPVLPEQDLYSITSAAGARGIDAIADNLAGYGPGRIVPRSQKFVGGVLLTFPITNDNFIVDFFNKWFNSIYSGGRNANNKPYLVQYYDTHVYNVKMRLKILDPNGNINKTLLFHEVFPVECMPFEFNMAQANEYLKYQVLMNYREFTLI
jgi:hypothetical protein